MSSPGRRLSGLQKDVLALYRTLLRSAGKKPDPNVRKNVINVGKLARQHVSTKHHFLLLSFNKLRLLYVL